MTPGINHLQSSKNAAYYKTSYSNVKQAFDIPASHSSATKKKEEKGAKQPGFTGVFDDESFARMLSIGSSTPVTTEKQINWMADGKEQLTDEQIAYLKENYDIRNMSKQDYYNLMADLTQMNVLSGEEVTRQHCSPIIMGVTPIDSPMSVSEGDEYCTIEGNLLHYVDSKYRNQSNLLEALNRRVSSFTSQKEMWSVNEKLIEEKEMYKKLYGIYDLIS